MTLRDLIGGGEKRIKAIGRRMAEEYRITQTQWIWNGSWLKAGVRKFSNSQGDFSWECVERPSHREEVADGVDVLGMAKVLRSSHMDSKLASAAFRRHSKNSLLELKKAV
jgi:hypothetical protein